MKLVKKITYKLIVSLCIVLTFCSFLASTPVNAAGKVKDDFYYSGTTRGSYTLEKSLLEKIAKAIPSLSEILDYLLGLATMGVRIVFVGWTALMERMLTWVLEMAVGDSVNIEKIDSNSFSDSDDYITLDAIVFNRVPLLNINFFQYKVNHKYDATGREIKEKKSNGNGASNGANTGNGSNSGTATGATASAGASDDGLEDPTPEEEETLIFILKKAIAGWYYTFRAISVMAMLVILVYIGLKLALSTLASKKALYKRVLMDWLVGMVIVFSIHFIMLAIIDINEIFVSSLAKLRDGVSELQVYEYGLIERAKEPVKNDELEVNLYDEVKTRAYDAKLSVGTTGMIMYMVLVYYAWKYTFIYLKRYLTVAVLTIIAPLVAASYAFDKVRARKSVIFNKWLKEYIFTVLLQTIHALIYLIFLDTALGLALNSVAAIILVFALMNVMSKADSLFRKIFGFTSSLSDDVAQGGGLKEAFDDLKGIGTAMAGGKLAKAYMKTSTRILTKPVRLGIEKTGTKAFGSIMATRANIKAKALDKEKKEYYRKNKTLDGFKSSEESDKISKLKNIRTASIAHAISTGKLDVSKLQESVNSLKIGQAIKDENDIQVGTVDEKYIAREQAAMAEINEVNSNLGKYESEYQKLTSRGNIAKRYVSDKWKEIMDPSQYTEKGKDGVYRAISKKRQDDADYETSLGKALFGGKTTDSVSKRLLNNLKPTNLANLNAEEKEALKAQIAYAKSGITGFFGIAMGLPLMVAEPKLGFMVLSSGASNSIDYLSSRGKGQIKSISKIKKTTEKQKYIFGGFGIGSVQTIANNSKEMATSQVDELTDAKAEADESIVNNVKKRHPKLAKGLKKGKRISLIGNISSLIKEKQSTPSVDTVDSIHPDSTYRTKLGTPNVTQRYKGVVGSNLWSNFQSVAIASRKANWQANEYNMKLYESELLSYKKSDNESTIDNESSTDSESTVKSATGSELDKFADRYVDMGEQQDEMVFTYYQGRYGDYTEEFKTKYREYLDEQRKRIDELSDEELLLENDYEEPIEVVEIEKDGKKKKQLSGDSERALIDSTIIKAVQSKGVFDLSELETSSINVSDISKQLTDELKTRGVISSKETISDIVEDVDKKIKDRIADLSKKGSKPVEDKMIDESIIEVMRQGDETGRTITDPSKADSKKVQEVFESKSKNIPGMVASEETTSVLEDLSKKSKQSRQSNSTDKESEQDSSPIISSIEARKSILSTQASKPLSSKTSSEMKKQLKRKMEVSLDTTIMEHQRDLEEGIKKSGRMSLESESTGISNVSGILHNENGGVSDGKRQSGAIGTGGDGSRQVNSSKDGSREVRIPMGTQDNSSSMKASSQTDGVLQLLNTQTELYRAQRGLEKVEASRNTRRRNNQRTLAMPLEESSGVRPQVSQFRDGSRRVGGTQIGNPNVTYTQGKKLQGIDDIIKSMKK